MPVINIHTATKRMPAPTGVRINVTGLGRTQDIINAVQDKYNASWQTVCNIAHLFKGTTKEKTARNIYEFLRKNIKYVEDPKGYQYILSPAVLIHQKFSDCKGYSIFAASILRCLDIPFHFRFAKYTNSRYPNEYSHVYIVVPDGAKNIAIDATLDTFNREAGGWSGKPYDYMPDGLAAVNGFGDWSLKQVKKINTWLKKNNVDDVVQQVEQKKNTVLAAPIRAAFLLLVRINFLAMASRMYPGIISQADAAKQGMPADVWQKYSNSLQQALTKFYAFGGNRTELKNAIIKGNKLKPIFGRKKDPGIKGIGVEPASTAATIAALITAATPLLIAIIPLLMKDPYNNMPANYNWQADLTGGNEFNNVNPEAALQKIATQDMLLIAGVGLALFAVLSS